MITEANMESDAFWDIPNPTSLNVRRQLDRLFEQLPQDSPLSLTLRSELSQNALLPTLSRFMLRPSLTMAITWAFRPVLVDLCARWLDTDEEVLGKFAALGLLVEIHEEIYPVLHDFVRRFERGPLRVFLTGKEMGELDRASMHNILLAYYRVLRATPALPRNLNWDLACLWRLCTASNLDRGARWLAIRCYALQSCMSESVRIHMEQDALGEIYHEDCPIIYGEDVSGIVEETDGWLLPVLEARRIRDYRERIAYSYDYFVDGSDCSLPLVNDTNLSPRIANVHGILLLRTPSPEPASSPLVLTSPALITVRQLAVNISLRRPILLTSAPSSGKSTFLNHLAGILHPSSTNHVITIHLADTSLDPRSLLGSYVSSATSVGSFEWKDGVLVKAMREGRWVVLKDIDRASSEVLGLICPLAESLDDIRPIGSNATLSLGNRGSVESAEGFALFATRSVESNGASEFPPLSFLGAQKWKEIRIPESSIDDLRLIVDSKFPNIAGPVSDNLIDIWIAVKRLRVVSSTRTIGIRDLEKFCSRISRLLGPAHSPSHQRQPGGPSSMINLFPHPSTREDIFLDARDVFFAASATSRPAVEQREAIIAMIGEKLGLSEETLEWLLKKRSPPFDIEKDIDGRAVAVRAGHTVLNVKSVNHRLVDGDSGHPFSMHRQALRLISQLAACVAHVEPVLLTGETGTGKTSIISHLARLLNKPLVSLNLSNQTESSDLIGGFRPVSARVPALELQDRFLDLFEKTFSSKKNEQLLQNLRKSIANAKWKAAVRLWSETARTAIDKLKGKGELGGVSYNGEILDSANTSSPRKRRKLQQDRSRSSVVDWMAFKDDVRQFEVQNVIDKSKFSFHFVEGPLVNAIRAGSWVLLDEINLASPETLECIASLLQGPTASITLTERGSLEAVPRHSEFRLFACMNPATDVGKKDLPSNIRARFTEIDVPSPDGDREALMSIISHYVGHLATTDKAAISDVAELYANLKQLAMSGKIADGSNHRPHYNMRSLSRALTFAADTTQSFGLRRALWEGFTMAFTMVLDQASTDIVFDLARRTLLSTVNNKAHFLTIQPPPPRSTPADSLVQVGPFWLSPGPYEREETSDYILTPSVQKKLMDLARIVMTKRYPVLLEGPTSSGKTSAIQYLARRTGHNFVRINNHEHTDIQEYLGSYVTDEKTGKLVFRDGLLVRALRHGDWIVLDELNLAPTDVLEALNRLLDDNRELVIPETQEIVRPNPNFMLFATQNPSGVYAGRKVLSRALRNRFLEVHFEDVPSTELEHILSQRSRIAPSYAHRIVAVFQELQKRRQIGRIFEGKEGFATLRDLFRWADRDAQGYQELAEAGYMLLAERTRQTEDRLIVKEVIEKIMNVSLSEHELYSSDKLGSAPLSQSGIVWTQSMRRLFILVSQALRHNEPVLLVGETGSGKTSVCQVYAELENKVLRTVNCHQNTEAADIIGGLRPARQNAFSEQTSIDEARKILGVVSDVEMEDKAKLAHLISIRLGDHLNPSDRDCLLRAQRALSNGRGLLAWQDGPLVTGMRSGDVFLLDEISLADDSVLERLNSVLEQTRTIVLAEKGGENTDDFQIVAHPGFKFIATMNPGGDFGKKELSPALRNRFTEIWVPSVMNHDELVEIVKHSWKHDELVQLTEPMLGFVDWIVAEVKDSSIVTLRDILSWVAFCNTLSQSAKLPPGVLFVQGGEMSILDGLNSLTQLSGWSLESLRALHGRARHYLAELCPTHLKVTQASGLDMSIDDGHLHIGYFSIASGPQCPQLKAFSFKAPTSLENAFRLLRACQISKPILLEGSPGVGKTSLVAALAAAAGQKLSRINLSEQTDLVDLFGSDLPVDGHSSGTFAWNDAEFLRALKDGNWVLLDEMNLASQSVLEGLNAVFDHRGSVYIPELNQIFPRHPNFRVFAAQNPLNQGSGRKGLPKSFLNRFTKVYIEQLSPDDLLLICKHLFPTIETSVLQRMISFNCLLQEEVVVKRRFGISGSPWEFNLRDLIRWASLMIRPNGTHGEPWRHVNAIYASRFRTEADRKALLALFESVFGDDDIEKKVRPVLIQSPETLACGNSLLSKGPTSSVDAVQCLLPTQLNAVESALSSLKQNWLIIVTGPHSSGKTNFARALAASSARGLEELFLGSSTDTSDLVGSFEQISAADQLRHILDDVMDFVDTAAMRARLDSADSLDLTLRLKDALITARHASSVAALEEFLSSIIGSPLFGTLDTVVKQHLDALADFPTDVSASKPIFQWIDGPLIRAMRQGRWLLLDNANLCSPSVLDRLNSLCEANGAIVLTEKGVDQEIIYPHSDFRLIMTVDPQRGEISRAMRNRGIEIALDPMDLEAEPALLDAKRLALQRVYSRAIFDLSRRALRSVAGASENMYALAPFIRKDFRDVLSSQIIEAEALYQRFNADHDIAMILFVLNLASPTNSKGLLRLFRAFKSTRADSLLENLSLSLRNASRVSPVFSDGVYTDEAGAERYRPINHFLLSPHAVWLPEDKEKLCKLIYLTLEACVLISSLEVELQRESTPRVGHSSRSTPESKEQEHISNYLHAALVFVHNLLLESPASMCGSLSGAKAVLDIIYYTQYLHQAANQANVDFSIIHVVSGWIYRRTKGATSLFEGLHEAAHKLFETYTLSSGQRLLEIWNALYRPSMPPPARKLLVQLEILPSDVQRRTVDLIALLCARQDAIIDVGNSISSIESNLGKDVSSLTGEETTTETSVSRSSDLARLASEMYELVCLTPSCDKSHLRKHAHLLQQSVTLPRHASRLISYQTLLWKADAQLDVLPDLVRAYLEWHRSLWKHAERSRVSGLSTMYTPIFLETALTDSAASGGLKDLELRIASLNELASYTLLERFRPMNREGYIVALLLRNIELVICASFPDLATQLSQEMILSSDPRLALSHLAEFIQRPELESLRSILPSMNIFAQSSSWSERLHAIGRCWISLSQILLSLYVPNIPIDPLSVRDCRKSFDGSQELWIQSQIDIYSFWGQCRTGQGDNLFTSLLRNRTKSLHVGFDSKSAENGVIRQTDPSSLRAFWAEMHGFLRDIISPGRLERFTTAAVENKRDIAAHESLLQDAITNFLQRITNVYGHMEDLILPIELAMTQLCDGLSTLRHASTIGSCMSTPSLVQRVIGFPSVQSRDAALKYEVQDLVASGFSLDKALLLQLAAIQSFGVGVSESERGLLISSIQNIYGKIMEIFDIDFATKAEKAREAESLYRSKQTTHTATDDEPEDEQIRRLFPVFIEDDAEQVLDATSARHTSSTSTPMLSTGFSSQLLSMHFLLFAEVSESSRTECIKQWKPLLLDVVSCLTDGPLSLLPCHVDDGSFAFRLQLLLDAKTRFQRNDGASAYSFYRDANLPEARRAGDVVKGLRDKLSGLILAWPDQLVLQHLRDRCDNILSMNMNSPIAKMLGAVERLLLHTEDWQMFANRENSLIEDRQALIELIIKWRKLELTGWKSLLDSEADAFCNDLGDWWFRLYDATLRGPIAAYEDGNIKALDNYLDSLVVLMEDFITSSPLGQFHLRLKLLQSFATLTLKTASLNDHHSQQAMERVSCILNSIHRFYDQFSSKISSLLTERRSSIEAEVQSLVKLATWRDVNVHALQQSAQKTHKQLYRRIRQFREVLRQPIADQFCIDDSRGGTSVNIRETSVPVSASRAAESGLVEGPPRARKFTSIFSTGFKRILSSSSASATEELFSTIVTVQREYADAAPSKELNCEERKKWNSALLVRKRRSWNDFLKELKQIGLSPNVKPEVSRGHRNARSVVEHPPMPHIEGVVFSSKLKKIDSYFFSCIGLLRDVLKCDSEHHPDVGTRELRRGMSSFESAFSLATSSRDRISKFIHTWKDVRSISERFRDLSSSPGNCIDGTISARVVQELIIRTGEATDGLEELFDVVTNIGALSEDSSAINTDALNGVRDWILRGTEFSRRLHEIAQSIGISALVTEDEYHYIQDAMKHCENVGVLLSNVADDEPSLKSFCDAICDWLHPRIAETRAVYDTVVNQTGSSSPVDMNAIIDIFLAIGQELLKVEALLQEDSDDDSDHLHRRHLMFHRVSEILRMDGVFHHLRRLSEGLAGSPPAIISQSLSQLLPFLDSYTSFTERFISEYSSWTKSLLKLTYISGSLLRNIAKNGFCKPPELEDAGEAQRGAVESADGVGLGQGEGQEDVSNQIEDEGQFEGIKGEDNEEGGHQKGEDSNEGIDVDFELGGNLEDGPEEDSLSEEEGSMPDFDDEFDHDVSDNLEQVDKDFWDGKQDEKPEDRQTIDGAAEEGSAEMVAKEQEGSAAEREGNEAPDAEDTVDKEQDMEREGSELEEDGGQPAQGEVNIQMNDDADRDQVEDTSREDSPFEGQDETMDGPDEVDVDEEHVDVDEEDRHDDTLESESQAESDDASTRDKDQTKEQVDGGSTSKADILPGPGSGDGTESLGMDAAPTTSTDAPRSTHETLVDLPPSASRETENSSTGPPAEITDETKSVPAHEGTGNAVPNSSTFDQRATSKALDVPLPNPHRSLGDALKEVMRRFDEILDGNNSTSLQNTGENPSTEQNALEYAPEETMDIEMQALGPALSEEAAKLNKLSLVEEGDESRSVPPLEIPPALHDDDTDIAKETPRNISAERQSGRSHEENKNDDHESGQETMDVDHDLEVPAELLPKQEDLDAPRKVEVELESWLHKGQPECEAHLIWHSYDALTQSLSFSLCEQLRLILEPTRATRLMGDFRTGKRLNMKKIIPYIASNYTKDKIWLRRVRPSQREYQVLIALDDSRSMAESHSIHLAFQTLALVSKALNRLEVGDLAIASFGERMRMVHSFEDGPFTDQVGTKVLETFKFAQTATDVRALLNSSVEVLTKARERRSSSSSSDLWQLEIIISDGICQDHEELRAIMRKAEEEHILVVFIVIDAHHDSSSADDVSGSQNSIVNMTQAMYRTVSGRLELHMQRYLDSFPFEFFVILKNVEALPDVLADTLRQFFEKISAS